MTSANLDAQLRKLARRYYDLLEDQLYDPQPEVDGYGKKKQRQSVINLLRNLALDTINLACSGATSDSSVPVELDEDDQALCPKCGAVLTIMIAFDGEIVTPWRDDGLWEYEAEGSASYIESFNCPNCGWSATDVIPHEG